MEGYLILQRQVLEDLQRYDCHVLRVYMACQTRAAFKDHVMYERSTRRKILIPRGSLIVAIREFADSLNLSYKKVRNTLNLLTEMHLLGAQATRKGTHITVLNYGKTNEDGAHQGRTKGRTKGAVRSKEVSKELNKTSEERTRFAAPPEAPKPRGVEPPQKELDHVKNVLLKDCPLYLADNNLMSVDSCDGKIKILELWRLWRIAYPSVDIRAQILQAHAWEMCNPTRRKERTRVRFLNGWLSGDNRDGGVFKRGPITKDTTKEERFERRLSVDAVEVKSLVDTLSAGMKLGKDW